MERSLLHGQDLPNWNRLHLSFPVVTRFREPEPGGVDVIVMQQDSAFPCFHSASTDQQGLGPTGLFTITNAGLHSVTYIIGTIG